jgi:hypothetical protein
MTRRSGERIDAKAVFWPWKRFATNGSLGLARPHIASVSQILTLRGVLTLRWP